MSRNHLSWFPTSKLKRAFRLSEHLSEILWNGLTTKATLKLSQFCEQSKYFQPLWLLLPIAEKQQREVLHNIEAQHVCTRKHVCRTTGNRTLSNNGKTKFYKKEHSTTMWTCLVIICGFAAFVFLYFCVNIWSGLVSVCPRCKNPFLGLQYQ